MRWTRRFAPLGLALATGLVLCGLASDGRAVIVNQNAKIVPSDGTEGHYFGGSLDFDGSRIFVGARRANADTGAAYIYEPDGFGGYTEKKLAPEGLLTGDGFGTHVRFAGDLAFVSGYTADVTVGLDTYADAGAVWVFQKDFGGTNNWGQIARLTPSTPVASGRFGSAMAVNGNTLLVGSSNEGTNQAGAAYLFQQDEFGVWNQTQRIQPAGTPGTTYRYFSQTCDMDGDTLVVGCYGKNKAYVFDKDETGTWVETKTLTASGMNPTSQNFGVGTSIQGDTIVVGAYKQKVDGLAEAGAAYVFNRNEGGEDNWGQVAELAPHLEDGTPDPQASANFGIGTTIDGDRIVVCAFGQDGQGAAYVYGKVGGSWVDLAKLVPSDVAAGDQFGRTAVLLGNTAVVSASQTLGGFIGIEHVGAVYTFTVPDLPVVIPGDANGDQKVDAADAAILAAHWLQGVITGASDGDFNDDDVVDDLDLAILSANWTPTGTSASVPEPSTLVLLAGLACFMVAIWRRTA